MDEIDEDILEELLNGDFYFNEAEENNNDRGYNKPINNDNTDQLSNNIQKVSNSNNYINRSINIINEERNNNINYQNVSSINDNRSSYNNSNFNKFTHALSKNNSISNNSKVKQETSKQTKKKQNIYFQLVSKEQVAIETDFFINPSLMAIIKQNNGTFDRETKLWYAPYSKYIEIFKMMKSCDQLGDTALYPITNLPIEVISNIEYKTLKFAQESTKIEVDYSKDRLHSIFEAPSAMVTNLYTFQKIGIEFGVKKKGRILLADEMGVGKTVQAIGISSIFKEDWPVLILCPSSLKYNWRDEINHWLKDIISPKEVEVVKTSKDGFKNGAKFYILSYDLSIRMEEKLKEKEFQFAIADEAHYLKSRDAKRTKTLVPLLQKCKRVLLLSGTPILAKPSEVYPLLNILRPDLFKAFKTFGARYCDPKATNFGIDWSGSTNTKELHFLLSNIMIRRLKKDVLSELPPKKRQKVEIQTDPTVLKNIKVLLNKAKKVDFENDQVVSKIVQQEQGGKEDDVEDALNCFTKAYTLTGKAKVKGIVEYMNYLLENDCKFLVFAHHKEVLDAIEDDIIKHKTNYIRIDGSVATENRHNMVKTFQNDPTCMVAILGITACATGLTLTRASTVVFAELHFTPAIMIQAEDRAHRIGQEHNCVNVHYLYGNETVDDIIFPKLRDKHFIVTSTLDNKKTDMDVKKIKAGCVGDFETKDKSTNHTHFSDDTRKTVFKVTQSIGSKIEITDYFKPKAKKENEVKVENDNIENEGIFSLKDYEDTTNVTDINIHDDSNKRQRKDNDPSFNEFTLLEESFEFDE